MNWHHTTKPNVNQGIVIEEVTGRTIAVAYDSKDTALLAAAPKLRESLEDIVRLADTRDFYLPKAWLEDARAALHEAGGN
jgi:hypothetical protein